jgi:hypothetical protein
LHKRSAVSSLPETSKTRYVYTALDGQQGDDFGVAVSLSGTSVLIGAPYANYGAGSFYGF